jgi:hypothetical protein
MLQNTKIQNTKYLSKGKDKERNVGIRRNYSNLGPWTGTDTVFAERKKRKKRKERLENGGTMRTSDMDR